MLNVKIRRDRRRLRLLSLRAWRRRLVFWLGAVIVGLVSVAFAKLANLGQDVFALMSRGPWWLPLLITPAGFALCSWIARRYVPAAQGSGIPQAIAARTLPATDLRRRLLAPRVVLGKIGLTVMGLMVGASVGREGPTVQVGAGIMLLIARRAGAEHERGLILAGSAAGIAGAFNTPLAGIVFAIEEMSRAYEQRTNGLVLAAVIVSGVAALALVGDYSYFGSTAATATTVKDWLLVVLCGGCGGLCGGMFSRLMLAGVGWIRTWSAPAPLRRGVMLAYGCGLAVAILGLASGGATFGTGYEQAQAAVEGHDIGPVFWLAKFAATLLTALSGIPGGIFAPSLSVGAGLGGWLGTLAGAENGGLIAVLGMAGYFAGVVQAPMTAFVIIMEMTNNHAAIIPLMLASVIGYGVSRLISPTPLYEGLARAYLATDPART